MKKVLFVLFVFCFSICLVKSKSISPDDLVYNDYIDKIYTSDDYVSTYYGTGAALMYVAYLDINDELLESYAVSYFGFQGLDQRGTKIGTSCVDAYEFSNYSSSEVCDSSKLLIYSSGRSLSDIYYWELINNVWSSPPDYNIVPLDEFCKDFNDLTKESYICLNHDVYQEVIGQDNRYYGILIFKEYSPVSFELVCEPKKVKKGETSNCDLVIKAEEEVNKITIPMISELFNVDKYKEVEGWTLVENDDGTVTITSESGFKGEGVVLGATVTFKEDLLDDVDIELNDIKYTTVDGIELNSSAKDSVNIYEEQVSENVESEDEIVDNPDTLDGITLGLLVLLVVTYFLFLMYGNKKYLER